MTSSGTNNPSDPNKRDVSTDGVTCQAARDMVHRRIDVEEPADQVDRLDAHLERCASCSQYAVEMSDVMSKVASLRTVSESPPAATAQPIDHAATGHDRPRLDWTLLRIAAVIAIGFVSVWAWSASRDQTEVRLVDSGPGYADTNSIAQGPGVSIGHTPSPVAVNRDDSVSRAAWIINPRSQDSAYIPVRRDTGRPNVKMFALYKSVR